MLQERPVEPDDWKDKLDRLDNLPGDPWADKNAAWDKLYSRLHQKRRRKAAPWWLAAAVFLLLIAGASLFIIHTHQAKQPLVKTNPLPVHTGSPAPLLPVVQPEKTHPAAATVADDRHPATAPFSVKENDARENNAKENKVLPFTIKPADTPNTAQVSITAPTIKTDAPLLANTTTVLPSPGKLRVVHINELEAPAGSDMQPVRLPGNRTFRFLLTHVDDARTVTYQTTDDGSNPLQMKIRTQN